MIVLQALGFLSLVFLPGAWITFAPFCPALRPLTRLLIGMMLSPLVVGLQFYVLRLVGIPFGTTSVLLAVLNLPVLYVIGKQVQRNDLPDWKTVGIAALIYGVPLAFLVVRFHDPMLQVFYGHGWMHTDVIYRLAAGDLRPEEPALAGVALGYPWGGHVYQGVLSHALGSSPVVSFVWTNVFWLLGIFGLAGALVAELGGNRLAQLTAAIWLAFAVNSVGFTLEQLLPRDFVSAYPVWGAWRYAPWLRKFYGFDQMAFSLGMFAALAVVAVRRWDAYPYKSALLSAVLLLGIGVIYPILFPAAAALLGARALVAILSKEAGDVGNRAKEVAGLTVGVALAAIVTYAHFKFVTFDRVADTGIGLHGLWRMKIQAVSAIVVLSPLLVGLAFVLRKIWRERRDALMVLLLGAGASVLLNVLFLIPNAANEYKFMLTAAICLVPFLSLALQPVSTNLGARSALVLVPLMLAFAAPAAWRMYASWPGVSPDHPQVQVTGFELRLDDDEPMSGAVDAIRIGTPENTVVVAAESNFHPPTLTRRVLYVPYEERLYPGVGLDTDYLLVDVKGYSSEILERRRATVRALYYPTHDTERNDALTGLLELKRPVAILLDADRHGDVQEWLIRHGVGEQLYGDRKATVWLISNATEMAAAGSSG